MTRHQARRERRANERKAKKAEKKRNRSSELQTFFQQPDGQHEPEDQTREDRTVASAAHTSYNPALEEEFPPELIAEASAVRERVHRNAGLKPLDGFVSQSAPEPSKRAEINRANAQHSTGPKSPHGKVASSRNSLKHGLASGEIIIPGEDSAAFDALLLDLLQEHQPASATEELLVNEMAQSYWLSQRAIRFQNESFAENGVDEKRLALFLRYQTTHDRAFHKALTTLLRLKKCSGEACLVRRVPCGSGFVSQNDPDGLPNEQFVRQNASSEPRETRKPRVEAA